MKRLSLHKSHSILSVVFVFFLGLCCSQNQHTKWYFGQYAALDFMTNPPMSIPTSSMGFNPVSQGSEGTSSIADAAGNLLFYTNGMTVWNQANAVMANGTGLFGHWSSSQSALIVKQPENANIYYIFTTDASAALGNSYGMRYSIVDMSLAAGMGSVTVKNVSLLNPSSEKLCAVKHCNQRDIWILGHAANSSLFMAYLLSPGGLAVGVMSSTGATYYDQIFIAYNNNFGCMKASPMGTKLGVAILNYGTSGPVYEVYDFDPSSGSVSNPLTLMSSNAITGNYGCEFSPDGSKFYGTYIGAGPGTGVLYQWDLCAGSNNAILASQYSVTASLSQLQRGPDDKIYGATNQQVTLGVINNPNAGGVLCNYSVNGPSVAPNLCSLGLPNFISTFTRTYTPITATISCQSASFTSATNIIGGCGPSTQTVNSCIWLFGDTASGAANISGILNPIHLFSSPGTYTVKQVLYNYCAAPLDTLVYIISTSGNPPVFLTVPNCSGQALSLSAPSNVTYTWSTGANTPVISVSPTVSTTYTVHGLDINNCFNTAVQTVSVLPLPVLSISGSTVVCAGIIITQIASGAATYTWSNGTTSPTLIITPSVTSVYSLSASDTNNCTNVLTRTITVNSLPMLTIAGPSVICEGSSGILAVNGANSYTWNTGATGNTITTSPNITAYSVTGKDSSGCVNTVFHGVSVNSCTGIKELNETPEVHLYPNPSNGTFSLKVTGSHYYQLKVVDQLGKTVFEKKSVTNDDQVKTYLPAGIYVYVLIDETEKIMRGVLILE